MTTLAQEITNVLLDLDDANGNYFDSASLTMWINQACLDIARRAECLLGDDSTNCLTNVSTYFAPFDVIRLHEVTFSPNDPTQIYPLTYKGRQEMNAIWYVNQTTPATYPLFYTTWSNPPYLQLQLFPVPAQPGTLQFWYYRLPVAAVNSTDPIDIPLGYEDCLRSYVRYCARRKAGDPTWQDDKNIYEEGLETLITNSRNFTDAAGAITMGGAYIPGWLYGGWGG